MFAGIAYHQKMSAQGIADIQVVITAVNQLGPAYDLEIIDSVFWSLQTLAGSATNNQIAFPVQGLGDLKKFIDLNFVSPPGAGKIIRL